ncbi:MAG: 23S rRNA (uracil(1939)-C(5))-methyltransferase RlmD [Acholeplasmatales bacterium]|nr:MAG: 23S rRNA (uracil(1939)-C(5))-methyltransferase RlmD [Acholeplasmatales bacterium]
MVQKNTYYEVTFTDLTHDAMGVCKIDGFPVFVKDALKGEKAMIKITKLNKNFGFGRLIEIRDESPFRKLPICEHYHVCGGCNMMHMNYQTQLDFKKYRTQETLRKLGKIETVVHNTVGMSNPYYYRNKAIVPFGMRHGKIVAGLYRPRSHEIVDIRRCHVFPKVISDIIRYCKTLFAELQYTIYDETTHQGLIRGLMFRTSHAEGTIALTLITKEAKLTEKERLIHNLRRRYPGIVSIVHNINTEKTNVMLGSKSRVLFGEDTIQDTLLDLSYEISHRSFFQVNPEQTALLYQKALDYAALKPTDTVIDAYCGIGTIALTAARHVKQVIGIESVKEAVKNAQQNAKTNRIDNVRFIHGLAETILPDLAEHKPDVLFIDPPRKGCEKPFLEALVKLAVPRVIYVSCNVATLARDLNFLQANGYTVHETTPFDMFPQTSHVECVVLMSRVDK